MAYDIVVVGSGVAGLASAYRLAPDNEVLVVDKDAIANGTSSRASGVITTPVAYPGRPEWSRIALEFFKELDGTGVFEWTDREYVQGLRPDEVAAAKKKDAGADGVRLVDVSDYGETFDESAPYEKALVWDRTGYFAVDEFLATLHRECVRRGVEFRPDTAVESVIVDGGAAGGVETEYGSVESDAVVVAAGSGTRPLLSSTLPLPIKKFTWNVVYLDAAVPDDHPMGGDSVLELYWRGTRDGQLLVGTEHEYEGDPNDERAFGEDIERSVRADLPSYLAAVDADTEIVRKECCPIADATTPDAHAIIDAPAEGPDDLVVAAGFHGAGVMAADSIGAAVQAHLTGEAAPFPLEPLALDRFDTRSSDFPFCSLFQEYT